MMNDSAAVTITSQCNNPTAGTFLLPAGSAPLGKVVVTTAARKAVLLDSGIRGDGGTAACVDGGTLAALGGEGTQVHYHGASKRELYSMQPKLMAKSVVAVVAFVGALIAAWGGFLTAASGTESGFASKTALIALGIAFVGAAYDLYQGLFEV